MWYNRDHLNANERPMFEASAPVLTTSKDVLTMASIDSTPMKRCGKCGADKPLNSEYFRYRKSRGYWYYVNICRECERAENRDYNKGRYIDPVNKEIKRERDREYRSRPGYLERQRELKSVYRPIYRQTDKYKKYQFDYNRRPERQASLRERNKTPHVRLLKRLASSRRRAKLLTLPDTFTLDYWLKCLEWWGYRCAYCGNQQGLFREQMLTQEHFVPVASDDCPGNVPENILPVCMSCNLSKQDKDAREWLTYRFGKRKAKKLLDRVQEYFLWLVAH